MHPNIMEPRLFEVMSQPQIYFLTEIILIRYSYVRVHFRSFVSSTVTIIRKELTTYFEQL